jgi:hypothetical protein
LPPNQGHDYRSADRDRKLATTQSAIGKIAVEDVNAIVFSDG